MSDVSESERKSATERSHYGACLQLELLPSSVHSSEPQSALKKKVPLIAFDNERKRERREKLLNENINNFVGNSKLLAACVNREKVYHFSSHTAIHDAKAQNFSTHP